MTNLQFVTLCLGSNQNGRIPVEIDLQNLLIEKTEEILQIDLQQFQKVCLPILFRLKFY